MEILRVTLNKTFNYPIIIGDNFDNLMINLHKYIDIEHINKIVLVTNQILFGLYFNIISYSLNYNKNFEYLIINDNEKNKKYSTVNCILHYLFLHKYGKDTLLFSLGGGIISDICGLVSSIYYRGIYYISIPTTLLSQVDASIGGKNGINNKWGKNMIGTIYQPLAVIIYIPFLSSLKNKIFKDGLSEVVKYAIAFDKSFFYWLEKKLLYILNMDNKHIVFCIQKCCKLKKNFIEDDELEKKDKRILLNMGHTYAHALETYFDYKLYTHGESVSIGIILSMYTSHLMGLINFNTILRVKDLLRLISLPINLPLEVNLIRFLKIMLYDKKNLLGKLSLILLTHLGESIISRKISLNIINKTLKRTNFLNKNF